MNNLSVIQEWVTDTLNYQQQTVLLMALRGPDGFPKRHTCKKALYFLRACVCKSAPHGRNMRADESLSAFMDYSPKDNARDWGCIVEDFEACIDELPLHYFTHFMHAAQIMAYKHPDALVKSRWMYLYLACGKYLHMPVESVEALDKRLADFGRKIGEVKP